MEAVGPCSPTSGKFEDLRRAPVSADSFKDDIQAIGRAVERLREGFAGVSDCSSKPKSGHDSAEWNGALLSSTLESGGGNLRSSLHPAGGRELSVRSDNTGSVEESTDDPVVLDQTNNSHGRLSLQELRSADGARRFHSNEHVRAREDNSVGSPDGEELKRSLRLRTRSRGGAPNRTSSSGSQGGDVLAISERRDREQRHSMTEKLFQNDLSPLLQSPSAVASEGGEEEINRQDFFWGGFSDSASVSGRHRGGRKRYLAGRRGGGECKRRDEAGGGESKGAAESGSLLELQDALKAREERLLRLKRDVAVVATSAGGFKGLADRLKSDMKGESLPDSGSYCNGGIGDKFWLGKSPINGGSSYSGFEEEKKSIVDDAAKNETEAKDPDCPLSHLKLNQMLGNPAELTLGTAIDRTRTPPKKGEEPRNGRDTASRPSRSLVPLQQTSAISEGAAVMGGSPLVASAHEGLRNIRAVLKQRALEVGRVKGDAAKMADDLHDLSVRLRRSERKCSAQEAELIETRTEARAARSQVSQLTRRAQEEAHANESGKISHLRERLGTATGELSAEQEGSTALRVRLEVCEKELRNARERSRVAEEEAAAQVTLTASAESACRRLGATSEHQVAELECALIERTAVAERAKQEARSAMAGLRAAEVNTRHQAQEEAKALEELRVERDRSARVHLDLEAVTRGRTQAVEKLALAEAKVVQKKIDLESAVNNAEKYQAEYRDHDKVATSLEVAQAELVKLRATLSLAREGQEIERSRFEQESRRVTTLEEKLEASEDRRKLQEEQILLARKQVYRLDAKIEEDRSRAQTKMDAISKARVIEAEGEVTMLRATLEALGAERSGEQAKFDAAANARVAEREREVETLRANFTKMEAGLHANLNKMETELRATRSREQQAFEVTASLKSEMLVGHDEAETAEKALVSALENAREAEATAKSQARETERAVEEASRVAGIARQDKEILKRGLVVAQTQAAELRAENLRLLAEVERTSTSAFPAGRWSALRGVATAEAKAAGAAVVQASEAGADIAATSTQRIRTEIEDQLALALEEASEARTAVKLLKAKLRTCEREHNSSLQEGGRVWSRQSNPGRTGQRQGTQRDWCDDLDGLGGASARALRKACTAMDRVLTVLSATVDRTDSHARASRSDLGDPRLWDQRGNVGSGVQSGGTATTISPGFGDTRRLRAMSVDSSGVVDRGEFHRKSYRDPSEEGSEGEGTLASRVGIYEALERLRFEANRILAVQRDGLKTAEERIARLQQGLRKSESREAETAARLEESRELSREQTSFVEGVWQERRRLEAELRARCEEVERLTASEDAARTAASILEGRVEDLSVGLHQAQLWAKRNDEAAVATVAKDAMEALRQQLDDLRKEVDRTKHEQVVRGKGPLAIDRGGAAGEDPSGATLGATKEPRGNTLRIEERGVATTAVTSLAVLEGEFQRLRAKYEKAKGRIAALEDLIATSRRVSSQARKEFQGALDALKLSQALLLRIHEQSQRYGSTGGIPKTSKNTPTGTSPQPTKSKNYVGDARALSGMLLEASSLSAAAGEGQSAIASSATDAHVHELMAQASRLRGVSSNVKRLLQLAAGEVQGVLEDTRESFGLATTVDGKNKSSSDPQVGTLSMGTQTEDDPSGKTRVEVLMEELRGAGAAVKALEAEKIRVETKLSQSAVELAKVQELLRGRTAQTVLLEEQVSRSEASCEEARKDETVANNRLAEESSIGSVVRSSLEAAEKDLFDTRNCLNTALAVEAELRGRCEELALASGAFAAEVAKQKEGRARSKERSHRAVATNAAELRQKCVEFSRASEVSAAERNQLERELVSARAELQAVDADVAQVLDALASSEKERRRLEGELDRQSKKAGSMQRAAGVTARLAVQTQKYAHPEKTALCEKASKRETVAEARVASLKEPPALKTKRREELERECRRLGLRVTDLEAALISTSAEVGKNRKFAGDRIARYERGSAILSEENIRLGAAPPSTNSTVRESSKSAVEEGRSASVEEITVVKKEVEIDKRVALTEAVERAYRDGKEEERKSLTNDRKMCQLDRAVIQKDMEYMKEVRQAENIRSHEALVSEASVRERAIREVDTLKLQVANLKQALAKAVAAVQVVGEAAPKTSNPIYFLQTELRSVINSLQQDKKQEEREEDRGVEIKREGGMLRQRGLKETAVEESVAPKKKTLGDTRAGRSGLSVREAGDLPGKHSIMPLRSNDSFGHIDGDRVDRAPAVINNLINQRKVAGSNVTEEQGSIFIGEEYTAKATATTRRSVSSRSPQQAGCREFPAPTMPRRFAEVKLVKTVPLSLGARAAGNFTEETSPVLPIPRMETSVSSSREVAAALKLRTRRSDGSVLDSTSSTGEHPQPEPQSRSEGEFGARKGVMTSSSAVRGEEGKQSPASYSRESSDGGESYSEAQSVISSASFTSGLSSSLAPTLARGRGHQGTRRLQLARTRSVVVRDWKVGQRKAFTELDRRASLPSR